MAPSNLRKSMREDSEPEQEDDTASKRSVTTEEPTTDADSDYDNVEEDFTLSSSSDGGKRPQRPKAKSRFQSRKAKGSLTSDDSSFFSDSYDSDYDSDYSSMSGGGIGRCCGCIVTLFQEVRKKTIRNFKMIKVFGLYLLHLFIVFCKSKELKMFLIAVVHAIHFLFRFIYTLMRDIMYFIQRKLYALWGILLTAAVFSGKSLYVLLRYTAKESFKYSIVALREGKRYSGILIRKTQATALFCVKSPYLLGKTIVNAPWILYRAFTENTNLLVPMIYGGIGWCIVLFLYLPVFAYILHSLDILTVEDLDALGLKGLCIALGLIPEEKKSSLDVLRKIWRQVFT